MREHSLTYCLEFTKITLTVYALYFKKGILLLKAEKFYLFVKGRTVVSVIPAISAPYCKMKNGTVCLVAILIHRSMKNAKQSI